MTTKHHSDKQTPRNSLRMAEREFTKDMSALQNALSQMTLKPDDSVVALERISFAMMEFMNTHRDHLSVGLIWNIDTSMTMFPHSVSVAVLGMHMALKLGWDDRLVGQVATASLVHDLGKLKVPETILKKRSDLSTAEQNFLKMHVQYGYDQLQQATAFNQLIRNVVLQHHERLDGSGYPKGLKEDKIIIVSKLVAVANCFDEQLHVRPTGKPVRPDQSLAYLQKYAGKKFDEECVNVLSQCVGPYPPGTIVKLSDDQPALVAAANPHDLDKPHVIVYERGKTLSHAPVISLSESELTIKNALDPTDLTGSKSSFFNLGRFTGYYFFA